MRIYIQIKSAGKRRPILEPVPYEIPGQIDDVRGLICEIVKIEVEKYNSKEKEEQILSFLTDEEIEAKSETGKVGLGSIYSDKKADLKKAIENACQCYRDGIVRIFQNEEELDDLDTSIRIQEGDTFTFVKLVFLAGRMW